MKMAQEPNHPALNLFEYERLAKDRMTPMAFGYYASGANDEITIEANHQAYNEIFLRNRVLCGVGKRDTATTVLGHKVAMPVLVAPSALHRLANWRRRGGRRQPGRST